MPRARADDYEQKRAQILDVASRLFAECGYAAVKMEDTARRCGASKSMLYHYFRTKRNVLFAMLQVHVAAIGDDLEAIATRRVILDAEAYLSNVIGTYLRPRRSSRSRHVAAFHDTRYLGSDQRSEQVKLERRVLAQLTKAISQLDETVDEERSRVLALLLVGMLSWVELWYREKGPMEPAELRRRIAGLFIKGFLSAHHLSAGVTFE